MSEFGGDHAQISAEFLHRSQVYLSDGELLQASEKGWGAAVHAVKLYAAARQLPYDSHSDFHDIATELRIETRNEQIRLWERSANESHSNFYNDNREAPQIAAYLDDVTNLINLIRHQINLPPVDD
ncbi:MAG: hypothetical protein J4G13_05085 [Dehalococcoidia bacterium]|nr:hypothetical protein [Dehalococcoidia bacterium]